MVALMTIVGLYGCVQDCECDDSRRHVEVNERQSQIIIATSSDDGRHRRRVGKQLPLSAPLRAMERGH